MALAITVQAQNEPRPNIILIMADDLSAKDLGVYNVEGTPTPNLDKLAEDGMKFKTCWATPVCSPTRAQMLTGRYGYNTHWFHNGLKNKEPLSSRQVTMGEVLTDAGYETTLVGKWQLIGTIEEHGFDDHMTWIDGGHPLAKQLLKDFAGPVETEQELKGQLKGRPARYWYPAIEKNGELVQTGPKDYGPDLFVNYINEFIARERDKPFFVYYPMCLPHRSWDFDTESFGWLPTPKLDANGQPKKGKSEATLEANIQYVDYLVGQIMATVASQGLAENTIIMFTTDNGTAIYGKGQLYQERGPRVPMIISGGGVEHTEDRMELIQFADMLPTLAELANTQVPANNSIDGKSFAPLLRNEPFEERDWIFSYYWQARFLRDDRFLLDGNGKLWDCGDSRDEKGYKEVTNSVDVDVLKAKAKFDKLLEEMPSPSPDSDEYGYLFKSK